MSFLRTTDNKKVEKKVEWTFYYWDTNFVSFYDKREGKFIRQYFKVSNFKEIKVG